MANEMTPAPEMTPMPEKPAPLEYVASVSDS